MKFVLAVLLLLWFAVPLLAAAWFVFPLVAGLALWAIVYFRGNAAVARFLTPMLLTVLLAFVGWSVWIWRYEPAKGPYGGDLATRAFTWVSGSVSEPPAAAGEAVKERQRLNGALARERQKINTIRTALELREIADQVAMNRETKGLPAPGLRPSVTALSEELQPQVARTGGMTPDLLKLPELEAFVVRVNTDIDKIETEAAGESRTADELLKARLSIPGVLAPHRVDRLYGALAQVQTALRDSFNLDVKAASTFSAAFDRGSDRLTTEQATTIVLANRKAVGIDLCGFVFKPTSASHEVQVSFSEDASEKKRVTQDSCRFNVRPETQQIRVIKTYVIPNASRPLVVAPWSRMREIRVQWLMPLTSAAILKLQLPDDPVNAWPLTLPVETAPEAQLTSLVIPRYSYYYAEPPMRVNESQDALLPDAGNAKLADLAAANAVRVELMPWYLSHASGQSYKHYLGVQNVLAALVLALVTTALAALVAK